MAVGEYLPPVVTRLTMDIGEFEAKILAAKKLLDGLADNIEINLDVKVDAAAAKIKALRAAASKPISIPVTADMAGAAAGGAAGAGATGGRGFNWWGVPINANTLHWIISGGSEILAVLLPALVALGAAAVVASEGIQNVQQHMQAVSTAASATSQMFGQTTGSLIGLKGGLQAAQDAAAPSVYGILGSAIMTANEHFGHLAQTGVQATGIMQTFAAKVAVDFAPGSVLSASMDQFLAHSVSDLQGFGKVFGNLGNSIMVFGTQMPGLAEILLQVLSNATGWAAELIDLSSKFRIHGLSVITLIMLYEEFNRWGGLVATTLGRIGLVSNTANGGLATGALSLARFDGILRGLWSIIPNVIGAVGNLAAKMGAKGLGAGLNGAADAFGMGISSMGTLALLGATVAAAGIGFLIYKLLTARSAAQQLGDAMQKAVLSVSNTQASAAIAANMGVLRINMQESAKAAEAIARAPVVYGARNPAGTVRQLNYANAVNATNQYNAALRQQQTDQLNVLQGAQWISKEFGVSLPAALAIADSAHVTLAKGILGTSKAMSIQQAQILGLMQGYRSMGQPAGEVGADMTALAIQSGLAATQVSKLNGAWDEFMTNLTGGTGALASFVSSMRTVGNITLDATSKVTAFAQQKTGVDLSASAIAKGLTNITSATGAQLWQNFNSVISSGQQLTNWLRIAGAEGAVSGPQFTNAILGMVSSLVPLGAKSATAKAEIMGLVQEADPSIKTWDQLKSAIKANGDSLKTTAGTINAATIKMGDMATVAQNLGNVLNADVLSSINNVTYAASGVGTAMQKFATDIQQTGDKSAATAKDRSALIKDLEGLGYQASQAKQYVQLLQAEIDRLHGKTITITTQMLTQTLNSQANNGPRVGVSSPSALNAAGLSVSGGGHVPIGGNEATHVVNVHLDGKQIFRSVQKQGIDAERRTGTNGLGRRSR